MLPRSLGIVPPPPYNQLEPVQHGAAWVRVLSTGLLNENCVLVTDAPSGGCGFLVDPGSDAAQILRMLDSSGAEVQALLLTHGHFDHIGAVQEVREALKVPVYLHPLDGAIYAGSADLAGLLGAADFQQPAPPDAPLRQGQVLTAGGLTLTVRELPGHTPGHVVYRGDGFVLSGDTLFPGALAPTNLPGGDRPQLIAGILRELLSLPPDTRLYPGHGRPLSVADGRANPLFRRRLAAQAGTLPT
ncbi:MBL fold metallo-hydrolase [Deinococcus sp. Marseille-Q6407]|uniref:MBL fold metallo-hydrolase n=1 Tax=Deinococcus sp. Marseille-Q6407 TaxID=2969223 RepID=UPI0021BF586B|nr:MBL fold metallo-hydrolase [Deinococcus sp. Marseille-Q6407]